MTFKCSTLVLLFFLSFISNFYGQSTSIPDANFEQVLIDLGIDTDGIVNGLVTTSDISGVNSLIISTKNISDLTGIEDFSSLTFLDCSDNQLTSLNVNQNKKLKELICFFNNISFLEVEGASALETLKCFRNNLTSLNVSQNINLKLLHCNTNVLTNLNVNGASSLIDLEFISNNISSIDLSQNTNLINLKCSDNLLTNLNIFNNTNLKTFHCDRNQLLTLNLSNNNSILELECWSNQLQEFDISNNLNLKIIKCNNNFLADLDLSQHFNLTTFLCNNNKLKSLNLKNGNNSLITDFNSKNNSDLFCIEVDDTDHAYSNWSEKDPWTVFQEDCTNITMPPITENDTYSTLVNTSLNVNQNNGVLSNDYDPDDKPLIVILESDVSNGSLILSPDGSFIYTPFPNFDSVDTFTYLANNGILNSSITTVTITIQKSESKNNIIVPNSFTPNGDQINDFFKPIYTEMRLVRLEVYNTWGNLIYVEESEIILGWDGMVNNKNAENGNYLYKISAITINNEKIKVEGMFTLIR